MFVAKLPAANRCVVCRRCLGHGVGCGGDGACETAPRVHFELDRFARCRVLARGGFDGKLAVALLVLGNLDQGILPTFLDGLTIHSPNWSVSDGPLAIRIDDQHRILTVWRGSVALVAYPIIATPTTLSGLSRTPSQDDLLLLIDKADSEGSQSPARHFP